MPAIKFELQRGFTLIEVLIALAILSAGFTVIFQSFQQSTVVGEKINQRQLKIMTEQSLFVKLSQINPAIKQGGQGNLGDVYFKWQARPISPLLQMKTANELIEEYAQMYRISVSYRLRGKDFSFEFEKMGVQETIRG
ncbi:hypothetical protein VA7868_02563 [Vibrio aerogenes CECT 7868]|uniref:Type II secretion system protein I n=1 Tax=Vibrio aerogenes CECT 7868 TaxID=1216006 RepID=A0A1M5ZCL9_9VIBR|nr:type II secretion system protein [Vibrio aerogenes]SHI21946.1 hypothetical protein VA7868_02563 [Vibrio aerogenes CECT 7868]